MRAAFLLAALLATTTLTLMPAASAMCTTTTVSDGDYLVVSITYNTAGGPPGPYSCMIDATAHSCLVQRGPICRLPVELP